MPWRVPHDGTSTKKRFVARFAEFFARLLVFLFALHVSGVAHLVCDVIFDDDMSCEDDKDRSTDQDRCPLGSAHTQAEMIPAAPAASERLPIPPPDQATVTIADTPSLVTGRSVLLDIFRPPRRSAIS